MKNSQQLANRLREIILNGTWVANTNYKDQLSNLNWEIATAKHSTLNSIAVLAQHIHYYTHGVLNVFKGGNLDIRDKYSFDFKPINSKDQWETVLQKFWLDTEVLATYIEQLPDEQLHKAFVDEKYGTYLRNINGMIEHCYYHLGQLVLIKKLVTQTNLSP